MELVNIYLIGFALGTFQGFALAKFFEARKKKKIHGKARRLSKVY